MKCIHNIYGFEAGRSRFILPGLLVHKSAEDVNVFHVHISCWNAPVSDLLKFKIKNAHHSIVHSLKGYVCDPSCSAIILKRLETNILTMHVLTYEDCTAIKKIEKIKMMSSVTLSFWQQLSNICLIRKQILRSCCTLCNCEWTYFHSIVWRCR